MNEDARLCLYGELKSQTIEFEINLAAVKASKSSKVSFEVKL
jgi:hypothetical protein